MPSRLTFHFARSSHEPLVVDAAEPVSQWAEALAGFGPDGKLTIRDVHDRVVHVVLAHVSHVEMVERAA